MFGILENLAKAVVNTVTLPATLVADVVTMGGALTDKDAPYTVDQLKQILKNLQDAGK